MNERVFVTHKGVYRVQLNLPHPLLVGLMGDLPRLRDGMDTPSHIVEWQLSKESKPELGLAAKGVAQETKTSPTEKGTLLGIISRKDMEIRKLRWELLDEKVAKWNSWDAFAKFKRDHLYLKAWVTPWLLALIAGSLVLSAMMLLMAFQRG